jgi:hypothetical protein
MPKTKNTLQATVRARDLARLSADERTAFIKSLSPKEALALQYQWEFWARPEQLEPPGGWTTWLVLAGRGFGKALALDTPILTTDGWKTMGTLEVGDMVFDENGAPTPVTFVSDVMFGHECFDVVFSDGSTITADADHEWLTWTHRARKAACRRRSAGGSASQGSSPRSSRPAGSGKR